MLITLGSASKQYIMGKYKDNWLILKRVDQLLTKLYLFSENLPKKVLLHKLQPSVV